MKILITGAGGFVGTHLTKHYNQTEWLIHSPGRLELDLTNAITVGRFLDTTRYDCVIHTALHGRDRVWTTDQDLYDVNLQMWQNLSANRHKFGKLINIGTGMEYDSSRNIDHANEDDINYVEPVLPYAAVKNLIAKQVLALPDSYNLRLFGALHYSEKNRFFDNLLRQPEFHIRADRRYDYFNLDDLPTVIDAVMFDNCVHRDINCVYENKYTLSQLAEMFCQIQNLNYNKVIVDDLHPHSYTGDNSRLSSLGIPLLGLELGMLRY